MLTTIDENYDSFLPEDFNEGVAKGGGKLLVKT